jgi:TorA maturation chaperone TorD
MMAATANASWVAPETGLLPEDRARGNLYALLSSLFYGPPSAQLLRNIAETDADVMEEPGNSRLVAAWRALQRAAASADENAVRQEYDDAFIATSRPPVFLYASHYQSGFLLEGEGPLARLREELARLGLARRETSGEPEDHISALCDAMRYLITGAEAGVPASLETQRDFFRRRIQPWYPALCDAIERASETDFYKKVGALAREFFDLEVESFEIA